MDDHDSRPTADPNAVRPGGGRGGRAIVFVLAAVLFIGFVYYTSS